jgi:hypothetical protein
LHFPNKLSYGYLEKKLAVSGFAKLRQSIGQTFSLPSQRNYPISFKPKVAIAELFWKMQRKTWYSIFPQKPVVKANLAISIEYNE